MPASARRASAAPGTCRSQDAPLAPAAPVGQSFRPVSTEAHRAPQWQTGPYSPAAEAAAALEAAVGAGARAPPRSDRWHNLAILSAAPAADLQAAPHR